MAYYDTSKNGLNRTITIRCTKNQHKIWTENAKKCGLSLNTFVRIACTYLATKEDNAGVLRYYNLATQEITAEGEEEHP